MTSHIVHLVKLSWGEGVNSTFIVFDLLKDKIYIYNQIGGEATIYGEDEIYPQVFKDRIEDMMN